MSIRMTAEGRRRQLLEVARGIVDGDGPGALTMERVAERAGVTKPVVYRHFPNRAELVKALLEESWLAVEEAVAKRAAAATAPGARIRASFSAFLDETAKQGEGFRILADSMSSDPVIEATRKARWAAQEARWATGFRQSFGLAPETAAAAAAVLHGALAGALTHAGRAGQSRRQAEDVFVTATFATLSALAAQAKGGRR